MATAFPLHNWLIERPQTAIVSHGRNARQVSFLPKLRCEDIFPQDLDGSSCNYPGLVFVGLNVALGANQQDV